MILGFYKTMRYSRQIPLLDECSVEYLKNAHIAVIGAGGVASTLLPLLVSSGIGNIRICDGDVVSKSNLHRQTLYTENDIGKLKVLIAKEKLKAINSNTKISTYSEFLKNEQDVEDFISGVDLCIDTSDSFASRNMISNACANSNIKEIVCSASNWTAQTYLFDKSFKFSDIAPDIKEENTPLPIFPPAAHLSGIWGASIAIKFLAKKEYFNVGYFQSFDFQTNSFYKANFLD